VYSPAVPEADATLIHTSLFVHAVSVIQAPSTGECCVSSVPELLTSPDGAAISDSNTGYDFLKELRGCATTTPAQVDALIEGAALMQYTPKVLEACNNAFEDLPEDNKYITRAGMVGLGKAFCTASRPCDGTFSLGLAGEGEMPVLQSHRPASPADTQTCHDAVVRPPMVRPPDVCSSTLCTPNTQPRCEALLGTEQHVVDCVHVTTSVCVLPPPLGFDVEQKIGPFSCTLSPARVTYSPTKQALIKSAAMVRLITSFTGTILAQAGSNECVGCLFAALFVVCCDLC
jgi:hypothetical protein